MAFDAVLTVWSRFWPVGGCRGCPARLPNEGPPSAGCVSRSRPPPLGGGIGGMGDGPKVRRGPPLSDSRATGLETAAAIGSGIRCGKTRKFAHWR